MRVRFLWLALLLTSIQVNSKQPPAPKAPKKLAVVTTLTVLKKLALEVGGDVITANSLTNPKEDPHFITEKPSFKNQLANADILIKIGRSLEIWLDGVIKSSRNEKLISGSGVITASTNVVPLEVPTDLSRSHGDVHPEGNPHIWLSPSAALKMAENIKDGFIKAAPEHKALFENNYKKFKENLSHAFFGAELVKLAGNADFLWRLHQGGNLNKYLANKKISVGGWLKKAQEINYPFFTFHNIFSYFSKDFSLHILGQIEEKPGIAPSLKHLQALKAKALANNITHIVAESYYIGSKKLIDKLALDIKGKSLMLVVDCLEAEVYIGFIDRLLDSLVKFK